MSNETRRRMTDYITKHSADALGVFVDGPKTVHEQLTQIRAVVVDTLKWAGFTVDPTTVIVTLSADGSGADVQFTDASPELAAYLEALENMGRAAEQERIQWTGTTKPSNV